MHSCPECNQACYCNGDVDDIDFGDESDEAMNCTHVCGPQDAEMDLEDLGMPGFEDNGPHCQICGCSEFNACPGGCVWATPTLCSRCVR